MSIHLSSEIIDALEAELKKYKDSLKEILQKKYQEFSKLDLTPLKKDSFEYQGSDRGIAFVDSLRQDYHNQEVDYKTSLWLINKWGGIGSFKENEKNEKRIKDFRQKLPTGKLTKDLFEVISSLSKIASFQNHEEYFVYDSRIVYTLNWLILKSRLKNPKFFPMPSSRNAALEMFDLNTIITLLYKEKIEGTDWKRPLFIDRQTAYSIYCNLIKELNSRLFPSEKPYYLEMFLFTIADKDIFQELKKKVTLIID